MKKFLYPTDFSPASKELFHMLCSIAREQHAEVIVLHVISYDKISAGDQDGGRLPESSPAWQDAQRRYNKLCASAADVPATLQVKVGPLVKTIAEVATLEHCDMIALASFHHSYVERQYHGCVGDSLVQVAPCPVLCFRENALKSEQENFDQQLKATATDRDAEANLRSLAERQW